MKRFKRVSYAQALRANTKEPDDFVRLYMFPVSGN
jgi:hypothetical protein